MNTAFASERESLLRAIAESEVGRLRDALRDLQKGITENATDTVWYSPIETAVDRIEVILGAPMGKPLMQQLEDAASDLCEDNEEHKWEEDYERFGDDADGNRGVFVKFKRCVKCGDQR